MKKPFVYLFILMAITVVACKGNKPGSDSDTSADSGQTHVGNESPADSAKYQTTPTETGGKDTSGNGSGNTNAPKDTLRTNP
ncbi:hypothetical protein [Mucilaginibacter aquariorum]|uniref:Uncharacterized protein n=1 Tax=Mucilaginibacter aquariorum TaxID=2967225 RepID=A0ABT1TA13_9SPHI|nr:hypothetical protein [Mucilaginibacter aquariorum]MCQ6961303.1 hypothetical protein [Mucilaginibacter aquariorum]